MNFIDGIFRRADIQQIREFLMHGTELLQTDPRSCEERIEGAVHRVTAKLRELCPDEKALEEATDLFFDCVGDLEEAYMEIGLQAGALVTAQVCQTWRRAASGAQPEGAQ